MPNMSYCRFENTLQDLLDCYDALTIDSLEVLKEDMSEREGEALVELVDLCKNIYLEFGDEV